MSRLLLGSGLLAATLISPQAVAQSLPLGTFIDAIGGSQNAAPAPQMAPSRIQPNGRAAPSGRGKGTRVKPAARPPYDEPGESGRTPPGYLLGNG